MDGKTFATNLSLALDNDRLLRERQRSRAAFSPYLAYGRHFGPPLHNARPAAVMLLVEATSLADWPEWRIPLTVRSNHLPSHPGQISLPGGRVEVGESLVQAALRELSEELGIPNFNGQVIGPLQPLYVYNSNYQVTPFLAVCDQLENCLPCVQEVDRVIHLPLQSLMAASPKKTAYFSRGLAEWQAPVIAIGEDEVWGATAIVLGEFQALLWHIVERGQVAAPAS